MDAYVVDDTLAQGMLTRIFGETTRHNFHDNGDEVLAVLLAQAGQTLTLETLDLEPNRGTAPA